MSDILEQKSEHNLRTAKYAIKKNLFNVAMSRMYYAVIEIIKYYFFKDKTFWATLNIKEDELKHSSIPVNLKKYLQHKHVNINNNDLINISKLSMLRKDRNIADYSYFDSISKQKAEENIVYAEGIIEFMKTVR